MIIDIRSKLILGTANFGNAYGVANKGELLSIQDSQALIKWAQENGINHFDTAFAYGKAEEILGVNLDRSLHPTVDTKLDVLSCRSSKSIVESTKSAKERLGVDQISTLYIHNEELLQASNMNEIVTGFNKVLSLGLVKHIGVSVYSESAALAWKNSFPQLSVFQVPENICDRRLASSEAMKELSDKGNTLIVRSVFLQGLLLMDPFSIPSNLVAAKENLEALIDFAGASSLTVMELCLAYAHSITWASGIVVGVTSINQLKEIVGQPYLLPTGWDSVIKTLPANIIDPRRWSL